MKFYAAIVGVAIIWLVGAAVTIGFYTLVISASLKVLGL